MSIFNSDKDRRLISVTVWPMYRGTHRRETLRFRARNRSSGSTLRGNLDDTAKYYTSSIFESSAAVTLVFPRTRNTRTRRMPGESSVREKGRRLSLTQGGKNVERPCRFPPRRSRTLFGESLLDRRVSYTCAAGAHLVTEEGPDTAHRSGASGLYPGGFASAGAPRESTTRSARVVASNRAVSTTT